MASVKKFPGSENWYACYRLPTGELDYRGRPVFRRLQRTTGSTDRGRALQLAISFERAAVLVAEKRWSEQTAHRFLAEISALSGVAVAQVQQTEEFIQNWLLSKKRTAAPKTWLNINSVLGDFLEWLGTQRTGPLLEITPRQIAEFRDAELAAGKAPTTINKALSFLGQLFDEAVTQGAMEENPARGLRVKGAKKKAQKRQPFTFDQFRELVRCTAPNQKGTHGGETHADWQTFLIITGYTGGRQQEVARLTWGTVDFENRKIGLVRTKTGSDMHWIPMHDALLEHLRARADAHPKHTARDFVMPGFAQTEERYLSKAFRELILPRIGISQPYAKPTDEKGSGRKLAEYSIHSLRHSLPTWLNAAGVSELMRMRIVGHEDEDVSRGYTHTDIEDARTELAKVPGL
jgi:integrase